MVENCRTRSGSGGFLIPWSYHVAVSVVYGFGVSSREHLKLELNHSLEQTLPVYQVIISRSYKCQSIVWAGLALIELNCIGLF